MTVLRNISEYPQTARWGEPAGSFVEVEAGQTVEVPAAAVQDLLNATTEAGERIWEAAEGAATTAAPSYEEAPEAPAITGSEGAEPQVPVEEPATLPEESDEEDQPEDESVA